MNLDSENILPNDGGSPTLAARLQSNTPFGKANLSPNRTLRKPAHFAQQRSAKSVLSLSHLGAKTAKTNNLTTKKRRALGDITNRGRKADGNNGGKGKPNGGDKQEEYSTRIPKRDDGNVFSPDDIVRRATPSVDFNVTSLTNDLSQLSLPSEDVSGLHDYDDRIPLDRHGNVESPEIIPCARVYPSTLKNSQDCESPQLFRDQLHLLQNFSNENNTDTTAEQFTGDDESLPTESDIESSSAHAPPPLPPRHVPFVDIFDEFDDGEDDLSLSSLKVHTDFTVHSDLPGLDLVEGGLPE